MRISAVWVLTATVAFGDNTADLTKSSRAPDPMGWNRWVSISTASANARFVSIKSTAGGATLSQLQHQQLFSGRVHLERRGRFDIGAAIAPGGYFAAAWNHLPPGSGATSGQLFVKQLYLAARPVDWLEIQYGGLGVNRGIGTDVLGYHGQGFMTGQRVLLRAPRRLVFDTVEAAWGYLGDLDRPGINKRVHRLDQVNFRQYIATKRIGPRLTTSVEFANHAGVKTLREAILFEIPGMVVADTLRMELYQRVTGSGAAGVNVSLAKSIGRRAAVEGGYAAIDREYGDLNSDAFFHGKRLYIGPRIGIAPGVTLSAFLNHTLRNHYAVRNRRHLEIGIGYDFLSLARRR